MSKNLNWFALLTRSNFEQTVYTAIVNKKIGIPMVVRMVGTNQEKGREILLANGIKAFDSMEECVKEIVK